MLENVSMVFTGDPDRGRRLQEIAREIGWLIHVIAEPTQAIARCLRHEPDLVIIDDFPESEAARSIFHHLRMAEKGPFLVLNDFPEDLRFSRLGALSFIRMIKRDPEPVDLINAITHLIESKRESRSRQAAAKMRNGLNRRIHPAHRPARG